MTLLNDNFANAIELLGTSITTTGSNIGATGEAYEPDHGDIISNDPLYRNSVWWTWTAPQDGPVQIDTFGSSYNTSLGVYTGNSVDQLVTVVKSDQDQGSNGTDKVLFNAVAGVTYRIAVDGSYAATGNIQLNLVQESNSVTTLSGTYIEMPIDNAGLDPGQLMGPGANGSGTSGIKYNGIDFFDYGNALFNYTVGVNGQTYTNGNNWAIAPTVLNQSSDTLNQATISGSPIQGLNFERVISFMDGDKIIVIQDTFSNVGSTTLYQLATLDSADPDQSDPLGGGTQATYNDVLNGNLVVATANVGTGYTVGFGSADASARFSVEGGTDTDPYAILSSQTDPNNTLADLNINLAMDYGSLEAGQSRTKTWYIVFGDSQSDASYTYNTTVNAASPIVSDITFSSAIIGDTTVALEKTFTITVVYDSAMDQTVFPVIHFPTAGENPGNTLQFASAQWGNDRTYIATYNLVDVDETVLNIDVQISGARSTAGKVQLLADYANAFSIDTLAPSTPSVPDLANISDLGSLNDDNITCDSSPTFIGTGEAGSTVELWHGTTFIGSVVASASNTWSITPSFLADGDYSIFAIARDAAGNTSSASTSLSFKIDTMAPVAPSAPDLTIDSDTGTSSSDNITSDTTPTFSGTAEAGSVVELWHGTTLLGYAIANSANWTITPSIALTDGDYSIFATAKDIAGNISSASPSLTVKVDTTPPTAPSAPDLVSSSDLGYFSDDDLTSDATPTFSGTAETGSTVELWHGTTLLGSAIASNGNWTVTSNVALTDGDYSIFAIARDAAGNTSSTSTSLAVKIDTTAPAVPSTPDLISSSDTGTSSSDNITSDATPTFSGTAEMGSTVELWHGTTLLGSAIANSGNWTITPSIVLTDSDYSIFATAKDTAGNTSSVSTSLSFKIDTTPPVAPSTPDLTIDSDTGTSSSDNITSDTIPTFSGTAEAGNTVELWHGTTLLGSAIANSGNWTITPSVALTLGTYTLTAKAIDVAGNVSQDSTELNLIVDTIVPEVDINPLTTGDSTPRLTGTVNDPTAIVQVTVQNTIYTAVNNGDGTWILADNTISPPLSNGIYSVTATATDSAGNIGTYSNSSGLTIDLTVPIISIDPLYTRDTTPALSGTISDALATVSVTVNNTTYDATNQRDGTWVLADGAITSVLADGLYDIAVAATNANGNTGIDSSSNELTIDTVAPNVSVNSLLTRDTTPVLSGTVNDPTANIFVTVNGDTHVAINHGDGNWSLADNVLSIQADGTHDVNVKAFDSAGNLGQDTTTNELVIDTVPLTADIVNVSPDPRTTSVSSIAITFNKAVTGFDLADLVLSYNGTSLSLANASLSTTNQSSWILGNISGLTNLIGGYSLVLKADSGIVDWVGHSLTTNIGDFWKVEGITAKAPPLINFSGGTTGITLKGNAANNKLVSKGYNDVLYGVGGHDTLYARGGLDRLYGGTGNDRLYGEVGNDRLYGGGGADVLDGGSERDLLLGAGGNDRLVGGYGDDVLVGGVGQDILVGGYGKDLFRFNSLNDRGDRITGFTPSADLIDLRPIFARPEFGGTTAYSRFSKYVRLVQGVTGTQVRMDADGSGIGTTFVTLVTLDNIAKTSVSSRHFVVTTNAL